MLYTVYLLCRFPTDFECFSLLCCVIKEYHWKTERKTRDKTAGRAGSLYQRQNFEHIFSFSVLPDSHTPVTLWFIGNVSWCLFWGSWSTSLQLCRYRQVLTDTSVSAVICVFILCTAYALPNATAELISSELSLVQTTMTENVTEHSLSSEHKTPQ